MKTVTKQWCKCQTSINKCLGDDAMHMIRPWQSLDLKLIENSWQIFPALFYKPSGISTNEELIIGRPTLIPVIDLRWIATGRRHGEGCWFQDFYFQHIVVHARHSYTWVDISHVLFREEENMHQKKMSNQNKTLDVVFFLWTIQMVHILNSRNN